VTFVTQDKQNRFSNIKQGDASDVTSTMEVSRLKEEVEILRNELHRAEIELEDRCWVAPTVLQHWLQLTYELESQNVSSSREF
jgi:stromal interaction molecule 1